MTVRARSSPHTTMSVRAVITARPISSAGTVSSEVMSPYPARSSANASRTNLRSASSLITPPPVSSRPSRSAVSGSRWIKHMPPPVSVVPLGEVGTQMDAPALFPHGGRRDDVARHGEKVEQLELGHAQARRGQRALDPSERRRRFLQPLLGCGRCRRDRS